MFFFCEVAERILKLIFNSSHCVVITGTNVSYSAEVLREEEPLLHSPAAIPLPQLYCGVPSIIDPEFLVLTANTGGDDLRSDADHRMSVRVNEGNVCEGE